MNPNVLVIGTTTALSEYNSGATIRLKTILSILDTMGIRYVVTSTDEISKFKNTTWKLVVCVSYATTWSLLGKKIKSDQFWLDACDSWTLSRRSQIKSGELIPIFAYIRDVVSLLLIPKPNMLTFINSRDQEAQSHYIRKHNLKSLVFPNELMKMKRSQSNESRFIFIGDGSYRPNIRSVKKILQIFKKNEITAPLFLIGKNYRRVRSRNAIKLGYVADSEIFKSNDILIAPIHWGAGTKTKVVTALASGIRVITTREGSAGIAPAENLYVCDSDEEIVATLGDILSKRASSNLALQVQFLTDESEELRNWLNGQAINSNTIPKDQL